MRERATLGPLVRVRPATHERVMRAVVVMRLNDEEGNLAGRVGTHRLLARARSGHSAVARGKRRASRPNRIRVGAVDDERMVGLLRLAAALQLPTAVIVPVVVPTAAAR